MTGSQEPISVTNKRYLVDGAVLLLSYDEDDDVEGGGGGVCMMTEFRDSC